MHKEKQRNMCIKKSLLFLLAKKKLCLMSMYMCCLSKMRETIVITHNFVRLLQSYYHHQQSDFLRIDTTEPPSSPSLPP